MKHRRKARLAAQIVNSLEDFAETLESGQDIRQRYKITTIRRTERPAKDDQSKKGIANK